MGLKLSLVFSMKKSAMSLYSRGRCIGVISYFWAILSIASRPAGSCLAGKKQTLVEKLRTQTQHQPRFHALSLLGVVAGKIVNRF